ncbi:Cthe_2314 family HEPN domain-containing protein [Paenibacillus sp. Y5S-9]|uniref:Cthe_2314 family HEPN domain-containing protein n=1 Tax=Paenibacillus sp. Y5S-9 TaxID=3122489 RepID=UPI0030D597C6
MDDTFLHINYPTIEQLQKIVNESRPLQFLSEDALNITGEVSKEWMINQEISVWKETFTIRLVEVQRSLAYLVHFKSLGINDSTWLHKEKGKVTYFPDFDEKNYLHKDFFNFYVDVFFSKGFSSLEILAHILFKSFDIRTKKNISFYEAKKGLMDKDPLLHERLTEVTDSEEIKKGKRFRDNIIHNFPGTQISSPFLTNINKITLINDEKYEIKHSFGADNLEYTTSDDVVTICKGYWSCLMDIVCIINKHYE